MLGLQRTNTCAAKGCTNIPRQQPKLYCSTLCAIQHAPIRLAMVAYGVALKRKHKAKKALRKKHRKTTSSSISPVKKKVKIIMKELH